MFGTLNTDFRGAVENGGKPVFSTPIPKSGSSFKLSGDMFGAIASLINTGVSAGLANSQSRRAYRQQLGLLEAQTNTQKSLMDYQDAINVRNWNMQNEYNTPAAQRERLEKAGLNPNLMFGAGGSVGIASGSSPSVSAQPSSVPHSQGVDAYYQQMQLGQEFAMNAAQIDLIRAQADKTEKEAGNVDSTQESLRNWYMSAVGLNDSQAKKAIEDYENVKLHNLWYKATFGDQVLLTKNQAKMSDVELKISETSLKSALYNLNEILPLQRKQLDITVNEILPATVKELQSRIKVNNAQAYMLSCEALRILSLKKSIDLQNDLQQLINNKPNARSAVVAKVVNECNLIYENIKSTRLENKWHEQYGYGNGIFGSGVSVPGFLQWIQNDGASTPTPVSPFINGFGAVGPIIL